MDPPESLISTIFHAKIAQYVSVAGATLYFHDYFLTLGSEVELFWNSKGSWLLRLIVIVIRYCPILGFPIGLLSSTPLVSSLSPSACQFSMTCGIFFQVLCGVSATTIFCMRVCTLYESQPKIRQFVLVAFWLFTAAQVTISAIALSILHPRIGTINGHCAVISPPSHHQTYIIGATYITAVPCEVVILIATIYHALDARRVLFGTSVVWPVLRRLYTDGAFWFAIALCIRLFGCLQWLLCPNDLKFFSDYMLYALQTIVAGRFFLSLRRHIGNSAASDIIHVSPSGKEVKGGGGVDGSTMFSSSPPTIGSIRRGANGRHLFTLTAATELASVHAGSQSHSRRENSWSLPSAEAHSIPSHLQPYPHSNAIPEEEEGEEIQMSPVSKTEEYELETTRSKPRIGG